MEAGDSQEDFAQWAVQRGVLPESQVEAFLQRCDARGSGLSSTKRWKGSPVGYYDALLLRRCAAGTSFHVRRTSRSIFACIDSSNNALAVCPLWSTFTTW